MAFSMVPKSTQYEGVSIMTHELQYPYSLPKIKSFIQISMLIAEGLDFFFFIRLMTDCQIGSKWLVT